MNYNDPSINEDFEEAKERFHRQMLSAVSHDLKTPLATMIGSLEIFIRMEEKLTADKKNTLIKSALGEAYRLDGFVTNILDMAKLEGGMAKIHPETFDLKRLIEDSITRLGPKTEKATIKLLEVGNTTTVHTDPMLLGRVVGILLDNSLKHSGKDPIVTISYGVKNKKGFIIVNDNGPGIATEKMKEIFTKYARYSKNDQQNAGTGLGLSISRLIMQLLSGTVEAANAPEGGVSFTLNFAS